MSRANTALVERLYLAHCEALHRYFARRVRERSDAEDLAQQVYVRLLRVADVEALRNPDAYLQTIAANLIKEHAMAGRVSRHSVALDEVAFLPELAVRPSYPDILDTQERAARMREVLQELPLKCQAAVTMCYWRGMSYEEIGHELHISVNMVKKYLVQALAHCRRRMASLK
jgi:RNA polymerase sigma-70 factor (ECF subfamily)